MNASLLAATLFGASNALATNSDHFMSCYGAQHDWNLNFYAISPHGEEFGGEVVEVNIVASKDAGSEESSYLFYQITNIEKMFASLQTKAYRWALKQAVTKGFDYGYVKVKAKGTGNDGQMYLNFNIFGDAKIENAVSIDGDIQSLTCTVY